jgi:hypothetical protein
MKSWKSRLLMVFIMLAVVLVISVPAMAEDIEVECEADSGYCMEQVSHEVWHEDTGSEPQEDVFEETVVEGSDEKCFPFCGLDWWPY